MTATPFVINVEEPVLEDLRRRLRRTRWSVGLGDGWDRGTDPGYLKELAGYWIDGYDWRAQEASLNRLAHFKADVDGAQIHFVRQRGRGPRALPLLLLHGWPDSFYRYYKVLPLLAAPEDGDDDFDVVVPSLPGFGFTGPLPRRSPHQPLRQSAELIWRLMTNVLGHRRFAVAGGDGGGAIAQVLAIDHPESVVGIHLTDLGWHVGNVDPATLSRAERKHLEASKKHFLADGAYVMVQATTPQSLAPALNDSPTGLAAWILDRFFAWSDCDGHLERSFTRDELLTNIMIYWVTGTIGSSIRTYRADALSPSLTSADHVDVPVGLALFPRDIGGVPLRSFAERTLNVRHWTELPRGGHFAALEQPELLARDLIGFFRELKATQPRTSRERSEQDVGRIV